MARQSGTKEWQPHAVYNPKKPARKPNPTKKVEKGGLPWPVVVGVLLSVLVFGSMFLRVYLFGVPVTH